MFAVAPRRGAWIEIGATWSALAIAKSPLAEGRGLKSYMLSFLRLPLAVAPRRGAWIEIFVSAGRDDDDYRSPLAEGRGLKFLCGL